MASPPLPSPSPSSVALSAPLEQVPAARGPHPWLMARLDSLLSEELRQASQADRLRARVLVGATCFLLLINVAYMLTLLAPPAHWGGLLSLCIPAGGYVATLVLARRGRSIQAPALLLCTLVTVGLVSTIFAMQRPTGGTHAANMLLPALAVYLLGPRRGLLFTLALGVSLGIAFPLYVTSLGVDIGPPDQFWSGSIFAALSFVGAWVLGMLHSMARDEAQHSLERTLKELRDSEGKLSSLFESTQDLVCSLDTEARLVAANSALKQSFFQRFGREPALGENLFSTASPERQQRWKERIAQVLAGEHLHFEEEYALGEQRATMETTVNPIRGAEGRVTGVTLFARDITARKQAETRLGEMHRTLVDVSRQAGMAEIATGVLHNVGNTLNSVNISTGLVIDQLRKSRVTGLAKATELLRDHSGDLGTFLTADPQGQKLPAYLIALSGQLQQERDALLQEMRALSESVEHIKSIVSMQQKHARTGGTVEPIRVAQLIDEALRLHAVSFERLGISIAREYTEVLPLVVDRHKLLQILVNLLSNARHALVASEKEDKRLTIRVRPAADQAQLLIEVEDNGVGIAPETLARMFTQGFTTKKTGHGFGLHISALAATEMKGRLTCTSLGPGLGATFTLELPMEGEEAHG